MHGRTCVWAFMSVKRPYHRPIQFAGITVGATLRQGEIHHHFGVHHLPAPLPPRGSNGIATIMAHSS